MKAYDTISKARELRAWLLHQGEDDPDLLRDMLEGETDLFKLREWAIRRYLDELAFAEAIKGRKEALGDRQKAAEKRAEKLRLIIQECMAASGEKSYRGTDATVSVKDVAPKPIVTDESMVPDSFWKEIRTIDKTAINEAFKSGDAIPGVSLDNGGTAISIRSK